MNNRLCLISILFAPTIIAHNILKCINSQPDKDSFEAALTIGVPGNWRWENVCKGYQRAAPDNNDDYFAKYYNGRRCITDAPIVRAAD